MKPAEKITKKTPSTIMPPPTCEKKLASSHLQRVGKHQPTNHHC